MKIREFIELANTRKKDVPPNTHNYIKKLLGSHGISDDEEVTEVFKKILQGRGDFFEKERMPEAWSLRTYVAALSSLVAMVNLEGVAGLISEKDETVKFIDAQRKIFQKEYKRERRQLSVPTGGPTGGPTGSPDRGPEGSPDGGPKSEEVDDEGHDNNEVHEDPEGNEVHGDHGDHEDPEGNEVHGDHDVQGVHDVPEATDEEEELHQIILDVVRSVPCGVQSPLSLPEVCHDNIISGITVPHHDIQPCYKEDMICKKKVKDRISYVTSMIDAYIEHEQNEFNQLYLGVLRDILHKVTSD